jgi:Zn finger protein HypA/HybF involved in hydrogenase expression
VEARRVVKCGRCYFCNLITKVFPVQTASENPVHQTRTTLMCPDCCSNMFQIIEAYHGKPACKDS